MKKTLCVATVFALGMLAGSAQASSVTFDLNCTIASATVCTPGGSFGSVTLTDDGNTVKVLANLTTPGEYVTYVDFNWLDGAINVPTSGWVANSGNIGSSSVTVANNNTGPFARFDMRVVDNGPYTDPLMFTLSNAGFGNLDVLFFNTKDVAGQLNVGVRAGFVGSSPKDSDPVYGGVAPVPEPASLILLGSGLLFVGQQIRKRRT